MFELPENQLASPEAGVIPPAPLKKVGAPRPEEGSVLKWTLMIALVALFPLSLTGEVSIPEPRPVVVSEYSPLLEFCNLTDYEQGYTEPWPILEPPVPDPIHQFEVCNLTDVPKTKRSPQSYYIQYPRYVVVEEPTLKSKIISAFEEVSFLRHTRDHIRSVLRACCLTAHYIAYELYSVPLVTDWDYAEHQMFAISTSLTPAVLYLYIIFIIEVLRRGHLLLRIYLSSTRVSTTVLKPVLVVSTKPGATRPTGKSSFTHSICQYPWVGMVEGACFRYPWVLWHPLFPREITLEYDIDVSTITGAIVNNLTTPAPPRKEKVLEMSTPYSQFVECKQPKFMGIIHCSPSGSSDLSAQPYACLGRVTDGTDSYAATATHVLRDMRAHSAASGNPVMLRTVTKIGMRDTAFPINEFEVYASSRVDDLDVTLLEVPPARWSVYGLKAAKFSNRLCNSAPITAYTPMPDSTWRKAVGVVSEAHSLFKVRHTASTDYGASGSFLMRGSAAVLIHTQRHPMSGSNIATAMFPFLKRTHESWDAEQSFWREKEREYERDSDYYDDEDPYDDDQYDYRYNDFGYNDEEFIAKIGGKAGYREYRASGQAEYTEEVKDANWDRDYYGGSDRGPSGFYESSKPTSCIVLTEHRETMCTPALSPTQDSAGAPQTDPSTEPPVSNEQLLEMYGLFKRLSARTPHKLELETVDSSGHGGEEKGTTAPETPTPAPSPEPPAHLNGPGVASPLKACNNSSAGTSGKSTKGQSITPSSAQPSADSLQREGKKRRKRRRKKSKQSQASQSGTLRTAPTKQLKPASTTKQHEELVESFRVFLSLNLPKGKSTKNTLAQGAPKASPKKITGKASGSTKKLYAAALDGSSSEKSQKTPNQECRTPSSAPTTKTSSSTTQTSSLVKSLSV